MKRKYELTDETKELCGTTLHRIRALLDFNDVKAGDLGGWVKNEDNLSRYGNAWVYGNAKIYGNAWVYGNAEIHDDAQVGDNAEIYGNAWVYGNAEIYDNAWVHDDAQVGGNAKIYGNAWVYGDALVHNDAQIGGNAKIYDNAKIYGNARVLGDAQVGGDARVNSNRDYIVFREWWGSGRYFTWTRSNDKWRAGDFYGTGDELINLAYQHGETSGRECARIVEYVSQIKK